MKYNVGIFHKVAICPRICLYLPWFEMPKYPINHAKQTFSHNRNINADVYFSIRYIEYAYSMQHCAFVSLSQI